MSRSAPTVWTIGHSTRPIEEFLSALAAYDIELLVDVRRFPGSRRQPQFGQGMLEEALEARGFGYRWLPSLGGRRAPQQDSVNLGWRNAAFRGYADYMATEEFAEGLFELLMLARGQRTAVMCAELLWWRCHRRLISDLLVTLGIPVVHIRDEAKSDAHRLIAPARIVRGQLTYRIDRRGAGDETPGSR